MLIDKLQQVILGINLSLNKLKITKGCRMKRMIVSIVVLAAVCLFFNPAQAAEDSLNIPEDFKLVAIAGGVAPGTKVSKVEIDAKGNCVYSQASAEASRFNLGGPAMRFIYEAIRSNNFFSLKKEYKADDVLDGSFASLTVTLNNKTHSVKTRNIRVDRFDKIMIAINIVLPADKRVIYNEILE